MSKMIIIKFDMFLDSNKAKIYEKIKDKFHEYIMQKTISDIC